MGDSFSDAHALVIGVGADLPGTLTDAEGIARILSDPKRCAVPDANIHLLTGPSATAERIIDALRLLATNVNEDDTVTIYFSGHGGFLPTNPGQRFLVPYSGGWIDGAQFTSLLRQISARRMLLLLDCCYAAGVHTGARKDASLKSVPIPFDLDQLYREGSGTVVLSSSKADEVSLAGFPYSVFTRALIDALCGANASNFDGYVRVTDLAMHVAQWVPLWTEDKQHPQLHIEAADNYPVAFYAAGNKQVIGPPEWLSGAVTPRELGGNIPAGSHAPRSMPAAADVRITLRRIRNFLVENLRDEDEATRIARDALGGAGTNRWTRDIGTFWDQVLTRAHSAWKAEALFAELDAIFGNNPTWVEDKEIYYAARDAERQAQLVELGKAPLSTSKAVRLSDHHLDTLKSCLARIEPSMFADRRIAINRLSRAQHALLPLDLIVSDLRARAMTEPDMRARQDLQQLAFVLERATADTLAKISALQNIGDNPDIADRRCNELKAAALVLMEHAARASQRLS